MSSRQLTQREPRGFVLDARFAAITGNHALHGAPDGADANPEGDPLQEARNRGFEEGEQQAAEKFELRLAEVKQQFAALERAFTRAGEQDADQLREKLRQIVAALCETAIAPLALDHEALAKRIEAAAALLMRANDDRRIRINPLDLELVAGLVSDDLVLEADPNVERGSLRIETANGGVEDGPEVWHRAIREALGEC